MLSRTKLPLQIANRLFSSHSFTKNEPRQLVQSTSLFQASSRFYNYDHWYKVDKERHERVQKKTKEELKKLSIWQQAKMVYNFGVEEMSSFIKEIVEGHTNSPKMILDHGDFEYIFKFNSLNDVQNWQVSTDSGYKIGKTKAEFVLTPQNTGHFRGILSDDFDQPERVNAMYTGYANIRSQTKYKAFRRVKRSADHDDYNCFVIKLRGDGRTYSFNLSVPEFHTHTHTHLYSTPIYTHGGPYWQTIKVPYSKFFSVTHGRLSDVQQRFYSSDVRNYGFSCIDGHAGPFSLEVDYIGVLKDSEFKENFAYELYRVPKYVSNT